MPADHLTPEARQENAAALAAALGIQAEEAAKSLDLCILITANHVDAVAQHIAQEALSLLSRTVRKVSTTATQEIVAAELIIGSRQSRTVGIKVFVQILDDRAIIGRSVRPATHCAEIPRILGLLVACYASAVTLHRALGGALPFGLPEPLIIEFEQLGIDLKAVAQPLLLDHAYLVGGGAIGNGVLWAIGKYKVDRLAARAQPFFPRLTLVPRRLRLQDLEEKDDGPWLKTLIVAVDSRRARRALQNEFPGEVFDASTTDIREIVLHHNVQPTDSACLSCIYESDEQELSREQHIADHLGVSIAAVRTERISEGAAEAIVLRFPQLVAAELVGTAYDTLFKRLCAESALQTPEGKRVVAPFAFVSVLAGTMLALELVRRRVGGLSSDYNYWRLSPWHPPFARRRILRPRQPHCVSCANAVLRRINESIWRR